jgi:hypothetical protein
MEPGFSDVVLYIEDLHFLHDIIALMCNGCREPTT